MFEYGGVGRRLCGYVYLALSGIVKPQALSPSRPHPPAPARPAAHPYIEWKHAYMESASQLSHHPRASSVAFIRYFAFIYHQTG